MPAPNAAAVADYLPDPKGKRRGIGLCLSGGGFRATLFHLGGLRRLNELGVLSHPDLRTISAVSGGSIIAAHLATSVSWPLRAPIADWDARVAEPLRALTRRDIRTGPFLAGILPRISAVSRLAREYERYLISAKLKDIPRNPAFVLCATDMAFGANWEFRADTLGDYRAGHAPTPPDFPLARAVAASSCFPPFFNPMRVPQNADAFKDGAARREEPEAWAAGLSDLRLTDGGTYDNMGMEPVWKNHDIVLVSDGGGLFNIGPDKGFLRVKRYQDIQEAQGRYLRKRWLIANAVAGVLDAAYWGVGSARGRYDSRDTLGYSKPLARDVIARIRTDLDAFSPAEAQILENHGYLLADMAIRRHTRTLLPRTASPVRPPFPEWLPPQASEDDVRRALADSSRWKIWGRG